MEEVLKKLETYKDKNVKEKGKSLMIQITTKGKGYILTTKGEIYFKFNNLSELIEELNK